jgi:hypothetical protein
MFKQIMPSNQINENILNELEKRMGNFNLLIYLN